MPVGETIVMVLTVVIVVATDNLAIGVIIGVIAAMIVFARRVSHFTNVERSIETLSTGEQHALYTVEGELFFASSNDLTTQFDYSGDPELVVIDMTKSHVWTPPPSQRSTASRRSTTSTASESRSAA